MTDCKYENDGWKEWLHCMSYINLIWGRLHDRKYNVLAKFFTTLVTILTIQILVHFYKMSKEKKMRIKRPPEILVSH